MNRWQHRLVAVATVVGSAIFTTAPATATPAVGAAACAFAPTSIAVVVDFGDGSPVSSVCVPADSTDSGLSALATRADELGRPAPRFAPSGLLCAIDGFPSGGGCGQQTGSKYAYWSYWHGSNGVWSYAGVGPSGRAHATTVEGWRFQAQGAGNPSDPPPGGSADPTSTCTPHPPPTSAPASSVAEGATPQSTATSSTAVDTGGTADSTTVLSSTSSSSATSTSDQQAAAPVRITTRDKGGGPLWGLVAGGGLLASLGVAGAVIARRRRATNA